MPRAKKVDPAPFLADEPDPPGVNTTELARYLDRAERVEEEIASLRGDLKEIFAEAKGRGFSPKLMRKAHSLRKMKREDRQVLGVYVDALSLFE